MATKRKIPVRRAAKRAVVKPAAVTKVDVEAAASREQGMALLRERRLREKAARMRENGAPEGELRKYMRGTFGVKGKL